MPLRVRLLIAAVLLGGAGSVYFGFGEASHQWERFIIYLALLVMSSGMKVAMPRGEGTMSVNFPFLLLGILQLSPLQAVALAMCSVFVQCRFKVLKPFTVVQIAFNVANACTATLLTILAYRAVLSFKPEVFPAISLGATVYFFANTIPVALVIAWSKRTSSIQLWRRDFLWYLPFYLVGAVLAATANLISVQLGWLTSLLLMPMIYIIYRAYRAQMAIIRDREQHAADTEALHLRTIEGLAMAIEAKDQSTHDHLLRVRVYVSELAKLLDLSQSERQALSTASFLHDIGKLAIPEHIINKPGKLTHEEFEKMKIHPIVGADILERVRFPYPVVPIVRSHHEAWDGSGYPDGLKGEEIPIGARILTVVDCFDALASERPYRKAMSLDSAMAWVKGRAGTQFDPRIVALLEERYVELEEQARVQSHSLEPLKTDLLVSRGAAPGAGYAQDAEAATGLTAISNDRPVDDDLSTLPMNGPQNGSLSLITAASNEAKALFEMSQMLGSSLSARETISTMSIRLKRLVPFNVFAVYLKSEQTLVAQHFDGDGARCFSSRRIPLGEGPSGWVAQHARPILNGNAAAEPNYIVDADDPMPICSALSVPLFDATGAVFGVLTVYSTTPSGFTREHLRVVQAVESKFSLSLENALRFRTAEANANIDFITQLPNMRHFLQKLDTEVADARSSHERLGVVVCDLDLFKSVNDRHGHLTGNLLLRAIADRFRACCRKTDTVARMGGDEFVFVLPGMDQETTSGRLKTLQDCVTSAATELNIEVNVTASLGVAIFPRDADTAEELLSFADRQMYVHKQRLQGTGIRNAAIPNASATSAALQ